jgi:hypothetical protein
VNQHSQRKRYKWSDFPQFAHQRSLSLSPKHSSQCKKNPSVGITTVVNSKRSDENMVVFSGSRVHARLSGTELPNTPANLNQPANFAINPALTPTP